MPLLLFNTDELIAAGIFIAAYFAVRRLGGPPARRLSYLAVFAVTTVLPNPCVLFDRLWHLHFPYLVVRGGAPLRSAAAGLVSAIAGVVAAVRIDNSKGRLRGLPLAIAGIVGGALWAGCWVGWLLRFLAEMAAWR